MGVKTERQNRIRAERLAKEIAEYQSELQEMERRWRGIEQSPNQAIRPLDEDLKERWIELDNFIMSLKHREGAAIARAYGAGWQAGWDFSIDDQREWDLYQALFGSSMTYDRITASGMSVSSTINTEFYPA